MGLRGELRRQALGVAQRLLEDERYARRLARAVGAVQRGRQALERGQEALLQSLQLTSRGDLQEVGRRLAGLKRRLRALEARLEGLGRE